MRAPPTIINYDVTLQGRRTDVATYIVYPRNTNFENLEDERQLTSGTALIDFRAERGERIDSVLARFVMARLQADSAGLDVPNFQIFVLILFRALGV
eukprot:4529519-Pyramimonas_sp.AAC.1